MAKERRKKLRMLARTADGGWSDAPEKSLKVSGSQLSLDPLTLTTRIAGKALVERICEKAVWEETADGFCFSFPPITKAELQNVAEQARAIMHRAYTPPKVKEGAEDPEEAAARSQVSFLTRTSKMGCYSFNLPAGPPEFGGACPASGIGFLYRQEKPHKDDPRYPERSKKFEYTDWEKFTPNDGRRKIAKQTWICNACYALKGNYAYTGNQIGQMIKFAMVKKMLQPGGWKGRDFASYMIEAIKWARAKSKHEIARTPPQLLHHIPHPDYFRIHDAGDFFREEYYMQWLKVMQAFKGVKFWAPTRMWAVEKPLRYLVKGPTTKNLALRPSALHFGDPAPNIPGLSWGASAAPAELVPSTVWTCPAYEQEDVFGGSGIEPVADYDRSAKTYSLREGFYYCRHPDGGDKWIIVPENDLSACQRKKDGKVSLAMEAGSCQRAHGPASPGLPAGKRFLKVIDKNDLPVRQGGFGCRACWDTTTPVWYHEH